MRLSPVLCGAAIVLALAAACAGPRSPAAPTVPETAAQPAAASDRLADRPPAGVADAAPQRGSREGDPAPLPPPDDPLERLYGRKQLTFARGEPSVSVRLMEAQREVVVAPKGRMRLTARGGLNKVLEAPAGTAWTIRLRNWEAGEVLWSVQVAEHKFADRVVADEAVERWKAGGYAARIEVAGSLFGIAGRVLDNRRHQVFLGPPTSEEAARDVLKELHQRFGVQGTLASVLKRRPHGLVEVADARGAVFAVAQDLVSITSLDGGALTVRAVEHGVGYDWHGREDRSYRGDLEIVVDKHEGLAVVNVLPLETYLKGIVPSEIFAKAHPEALKAQAVTARGEVLAKVGTRHLTDPYLLCAEQHCQVYKGESGEASPTSAAVAATRGEALFAPGGGALVGSVYSAVCGGHTEDNDAVWGGIADPSLRGRPDLVGAPPAAFAGGIGDKNLHAFLTADLKAWCRVSSFSKPGKFRWERRFSEAEVDELAKPFGVGHVRVVAVARRGRSGRATVLTVSGDDGATQVRGELSIRRLFKNLNSAMFEVEPPGKAHPDWLFRGGGWGHGAGMCQVGAIGRAEAGQGYRDILRYYFNGAEIVALY